MKLSARLCQIEERTVAFPDGTRATWEVAAYPDQQTAVACLGVDWKAGTLVLVKNYRPSLGRWLIEVAGGLPFVGEDSETAARREFEEETGAVVDRMHAGPVLFSLPGLGVFPIACFVAETTASRSQHLDPHERIEVVHIPASHAGVDAARQDIAEPVSLALLDHFVATFLRDRPVT